MATRLFSYRPGLDGIRGGGMIVFMLWHVGALTVLPGLWIFMNVFFVLSAFLITRLLLAEARRRDSISAPAFYARRVRRLAPALLVMLAAVTIDGIFFAPPEERTYLKGDVLATLGYLMNWRLVARDDQYFEAFTHPSITRHAWSLSVEEQFYLLVPLLVLVVLLHVRTRSTRTAVFVGIALLSAAWATTLDLSSLRGQAHAYYGTDVRLQALALGVAAGIWTGHVGRGSALLQPRDRRDILDRGLPALEILGWAGFVGSLAAFATIAPLSPWMFSRGGMLLTTVAAVAWVLGCAQRRATPLVRLHSFAPLVHTGKISYGLYLYHWPIFLWLERALPGAGVWPLALATLALTYAAAQLSYRLLERPVMREGLHAFGLTAARGKAAFAATLAVVVGGALAITGGAATATGNPGDPATQTPQYVARIPQLVPGQPAYRAPSTPAKVAMFGDSVPFFLVQRMPAKNFPGLEVVNLATAGCDLLDEPMQRGATTQGNDPDCRSGKAQFGSRLRQERPQAVVVMGSLLLGIPHNVDGAVLWLDSHRYRRLIERKLTDVTQEARAAGVARVLVTTVPCRGASQMQGPIQFLAGAGNTARLMKEATNPTQINGLITAWANAHHVQVIDLAGPVCGPGKDGYRPSLHGKQLYDDGIHFSPEATPMIWGWLAPQILAKAGLQ